MNRPWALLWSIWAGVDAALLYDHHMRGIYGWQDSVTIVAIFLLTIAAIGEEVKR